MFAIFYLSILIFSYSEETNKYRNNSTKQEWQLIIQAPPLPKKEWPTTTYSNHTDPHLKGLIQEKTPRFTSVKGMF